MLRRKDGTAETEMLLQTRPAAFIACGRTQRGQGQYEVGKGECPTERERGRTLCRAVPS